MHRRNSTGRRRLTAAMLALAFALVAGGCQSHTIGKSRPVPLMTIKAQVEMLELGRCSSHCVLYLDEIENYACYIERRNGSDVDCSELDE